MTLKSPPSHLHLSLSCSAFPHDNRISILVPGKSLSSSQETYTVDQPFSLFIQRVLPYQIQCIGLQKCTNFPTTRNKYIIKEVTQTVLCTLCFRNTYMFFVSQMCHHLYHSSASLFTPLPINSVLCPCTVSLHLWIVPIRKEEGGERNYENLKEKTRHKHPELITVKK